MHTYIYIYIYIYIYHIYIWWFWCTCCLEKLTSQSILYVHIILLFYNMYINLYTLFTVKVCITHIWKKDACVMCYTHIKTLAHAVWLSKQTLLSEGGLELWEINKLTTSQLLTLILREKSSGATGWKQKQDKAEQ